MALRKLRPLTPSQRFKMANTFEEVTASKPEKSLIEPVKKSGGRDYTGKMTMRYIGGGHKKNYRIIDFKRSKLCLMPIVQYRFLLIPDSQTFQL